MKNYFLFLIISNFLQISYEIIIIPFHYLNDRTKNDYNFNDISGKEFLEFTTSKLVSTILIGSPLKPLELYITMDYKFFFIGNGYCEKNSISFYEPIKSSLFKNDTFYASPFDDLRNMTIGNDSCTIFSSYNLGENTTLNEINLLYGSKVNILNNIYDKDKVCGIMGFKLHDMEYSYYLKFSKFSFENSLKFNKIDNYSDWTIEFFSDKEKNKNKGFDGYLIYGATENKYLKEVKQIDVENIQFSYCNSLSNVLEWSISLKEVYYISPISGNKTKIFQTTRVEFNFDLDYYFAPKEYFDSIKDNFFKPYLDSGECKIQTLKEFYLRYKFIVCDKNFIKEISKFPKLSFVHKGYNYIFNITYEDCFKEINNQILFLLFYDPWSINIFKVGKNFLKKYQFIFRTDHKTIGFINSGNDNNGNYEREQKKEEQRKLENKQLILIIILIVLILGIIIGFFIGKKLSDKKRAKRANELLDEDYDYEVPQSDNKKNIIYIKLFLFKEIVFLS